MPTTIIGHPVAAGTVHTAHDPGHATAERRIVHYDCPRGHDVPLLFAIGAEAPREWPCPTCQEPATLHGAPAPDDPGDDALTAEQLHSPAFPGSWATRFHLRELHKRRTNDELEATLAERLHELRVATSPAAPIPG